MKPRRRVAKKPRRRKIVVKITPPKTDEGVTLFFEARFCCVPTAKAGICCSHPAKVLSVSATRFKAMCFDKSEWDVVVHQKRTALFPDGTWTHMGANASAHVADDTFDEDL